LNDLWDFVIRRVVKAKGAESSALDIISENNVKAVRSRKASR
jgi:hypothetical protein